MWSICRSVGRMFDVYYTVEGHMLQNNWWLHSFYYCGTLIFQWVKKRIYPILSLDIVGGELALRSLGTSFAPLLWLFVRRCCVTMRFGANASKQLWLYFVLLMWSSDFTVRKKGEKFVTRRCDRELAVRSVRGSFVSFVWRCVRTLYYAQNGCCRKCFKATLGCMSFY